MCIRDSINAEYGTHRGATMHIVAGCRQIGRCFSRTDAVVHTVRLTTTFSLQQRHVVDTAEKWVPMEDRVAGSRHTQSDRTSEEEISKWLVQQSSIHESYKILEQLGEGHFGAVMRATHRATQEQVAIKRMPKETNPYALREISAMAMIKAKNQKGLASMKAAYEDQAAFYVVMPYCQGGDLFDWLVDECRRSSERDAMRVCLQTLKAIQATREAGLVHLDVKPDNFVIGEDGELMLVDFGSAESLAPNHDQNQLLSADRQVGSVEYLPPELALTNQFSSHTDVWGAGVILYTCLLYTSPSPRDS
eukprot:TRINITY_DN44_c0_g1_i3.p1 TRINITY_DN44_c0_g1~~TRINITY_DN44_c0_g1_i3.p1  ORF type:complete len:305 (+),score=61.77 TRINITY_DN44_c0_g1_i3:133-1047(+)